MGVRWLPENNEMVEGQNFKASGHCARATPDAAAVHRPQPPLSRRGPCPGPARPPPPTPHSTHCNAWDTGPQCRARRQTGCVHPLLTRYVFARALVHATLGHENPKCVQAGRPPARPTETHFVNTSKGCCCGRPQVQGAPTIPGAGGARHASAPPRPDWHAADP